MQRRIGESGGIDTLLQCVAMYKSRDPATAEEEEFMQNCFDLLCTCLMVQENKAAFVKVCAGENGGATGEKYALSLPPAHASIALDACCLPLCLPRTTPPPPWLKQLHHLSL